MTVELTLSEQYITVEVGESKQIKVYERTTIDGVATDKDVTKDADYSRSDVEKAKIVEGLVTGVSESEEWVLIYYEEHYVYLHVTVVPSTSQPPEPDPEDIYIVAVSSIKDVEVEYGTSFNDLELPDNLWVSGSDGEWYLSDIDWLSNTYDGTVEGKQTIYGDLTMRDSEIKNPGNLRAQVNVFVGEKEEPEPEPEPSPSADSVFLRFGYRSDTSVPESRRFTSTKIQMSQLEKGSKATDYSPAPEDTDAKINHIETEFTQTFDSFSQTVAGIDGRVTTQTQEIDRITQTIQDVNENVEGNTTKINQTISTVDSHSQTIATIETDLDGKVETSEYNTLVSTVDSTIRRIGDAEGNITQIESSINGLQTTVAGKASQSQVTQLADGFRVFAGSVNTVNKNLADKWVSQRINNDGTATASSSSRAIPMTDVPDNATHLTIEDGTWGGWYNSAFFWYNSRQHFLGKYDLATNEDPGENIVTVEIPSNAKYFRYHTTPNMSEETKIEVGTEATGLFYDDSEVYSQISVLQDNINLRVTKGDVVNQINISDESILIDASRVHIGSSTIIDDGIITNSMVASDISADKVTTGTLNAANVRLINLDFETAVGNRTEFVRSAWNDGLNNVTVDASGMYMTGSGTWRRSYLSATGFDLYNGSGSYNKSGVIGYFKNNVASASGSESIMDTGSDTKHSLGIGVNYTHDLTLGYNPYSTTDRIFLPAVQIEGTRGVVRFHTALTDSTGVYGFEIVGSNFYGTYGTSIQSRHESFSRIHLSKGVTTLSSASRIEFRTQKGAESFRADYKGINMMGNSISNQSDRRLKYDIQATHTDSLNAIKRWQFVNFEWKENTKPMGVQFGLIAQDTPELATYDNDSGYYSIDSSEQLMMTTHAVQQLALHYDVITKSVESNESKIHKMQKELSKANRRIEELEGAI